MKGSSSLKLVFVKKSNRLIQSHFFPIKNIVKKLLYPPIPRKDGNKRQKHILHGKF